MSDTHSVWDKVLKAHNGFLDGRIEIHRFEAIIRGTISRFENDGKTITFTIDNPERAEKLKGDYMTGPWKKCRRARFKFRASSHTPDQLSPDAYRCNRADDQHKYFYLGTADFAQ